MDEAIEKLNEQTRAYVAELEKLVRDAVARRRSDFDWGEWDSRAVRALYIVPRPEEEQWAAEVLPEPPPSATEAATRLWLRPKQGKVADG